MLLDGLEAQPTTRPPIDSTLVLGNKRSSLPGPTEAVGEGAVFLLAFQRRRAYIAKKGFCLVGPPFPESLCGGHNIYLERFNCLHVGRSRSQGNHAMPFLKSQDS